MYRKSDNDGAKLLPIPVKFSPLNANDGILILCSHVFQLLTNIPPETRLPSSPAEIDNWKLMYLRGVQGMQKL